MAKGNKKEEKKVDEKPAKGKKVDKVEADPVIKLANYRLYSMNDFNLKLVGCVSEDTLKAIKKLIKDSGK